MDPMGPIDEISRQEFPGPKGRPHDDWVKVMKDSQDG